jgi:TDG/mug DNA glycosylase family protein
MAAGIIERRIDPAAGMSDADREHLQDRGIGITNLAPRATARADELTAEELKVGGERLRALVEEVRPRVVAVAGITAYRMAFGERRAVAGRQPEPLGGAELWVVPNPSGLNAHHTVATLAEAYAEPARAAGLLPDRTSDRLHP